MNEVDTLAIWTFHGYSCGAPSLGMPVYWAPIGRIRIVFVVAFVVV